MTRPSRTAATPARRRRARPRRGAAYVLVLSTGVLLSVVGLGILSVSRAGSRVAGQAADLDEAAVLAEAAAAWGVAAVKADAGWRTTYANNVETSRRVVGRGQISFKLVDAADGNLANNPSDAARLYGIGRVGAATRVYSVNLTAAGGALDSLRNPVQAGAGLNVTSSLTVTGGPLSANGTLSVATGVTVTGDVEGTAVTLAGTGQVTGAKTTLPAPRSLPQASVFDTYKGLATEIPFASITGGTISTKVISGVSNPWGTPNAAGVYYIRVPSTGTLTIKTSRIVGTFVVELDGGGKLATSGAFAWDPPRADYPSLIVKGTTGCSVSLGGSSTALDEGLMTNYNPPGTPDANGVTDADKTDTYPAEFHGLLHVIGTGFPTTLTNYFNLKGCLVAEGAVQTALGVKIAIDPTLATTPPAGYTSAAVVRFGPGTWRWETTP